MGHLLGKVRPAKFKSKSKNPVKPKVNSKRKKAAKTSVRTAPLNKSRVTKLGTPMISQSTGSTGGIRVKFRELIDAGLGPSTSASNFVLLRAHQLNPGVSTTFPWLSGIASQYDQYIVHKCKFEYVNSAAATTRGFIYQVIDYDSLDKLPNSALEMVNQMYAVSGPVWACQEMEVRSKAAMNLGARRYVRSKITTNRSLDVTDFGVHIIACDQVSESGTLGQLWVEYDIELLAPQVSAADESGIANPQETKFDLQATNRALAIDEFTAPVFVDTGINHTNSVTTLASTPFGNASEALMIPAGNATITYKARITDTTAVPDGSTIQWLVQVWNYTLATWTTFDEYLATVQTNLATVSASTTFEANVNTVRQGISYIRFAMASLATAGTFSVSGACYIYAAGRLVYGASSLIGTQYRTNPPAAL